MKPNTNTEAAETAQTTGDQAVDPAATCSPRYFEGDLKPKDGDWVRWRSNGERWMVSAQDDIDNPGTALSEKEWREDVIFEKRP